MRTVDPALTAALSAGNPIPYLKAYVGHENGTVKNSHTNVVSYTLTGTSLEFVIPSDTNFASDQESIWLERGLTIAGTNYTVTTGRFFIVEEEYLPNGFTRYKGMLFPHEYYTAAGDVTYETAIDAFCTAFGKTTTYKDDTEAWLDYQFLPTGQVIILNSAMRFLNMLQQKRLITVCDNGAEDVRIYSADVLGSADVTIDIKDEFTIFTTKTKRRQYIWRDEAQTVHTDGTATDPLHNLGYLESTDSPPARNTQAFMARAIVRPDLRLQDGDVVRFRFDGGTKTVTVFAQVTEIFEANSSHLPKWRMVVEANPIYHATEGGAMPSTIERVSNYTPLNTSSFDDLLDEQDNNLQAAMETLDEHHPGGYVREVLSAARTYYVRYNVGDCTISNASPAVVTLNGHGLLDDDPVVFRTSGALPTGLTEGTVYYVNYVDANTFQVAATPDGASINTSSAGSGTHSVATGNNGNDGKSTGRAGALLTVAKAIELATALDLSIYSVTIQLAKSTYTESTITCKPYVGTGPISLAGDTTTPTNVKITNGILGDRWAGTWYVSGFYLNSIVAYPGAFIVVAGKLDFYQGGPHLWAYGGLIQIATAYTISGSTINFTAHALASNGGYIYTSGSHTVTLTGTPNWAWSFVYASFGGRIEGSGVTYSGACTGTRYYADLNGAILTYGSGANYFPGNAAGGTASGGQYS